MLIPPVMPRAGVVPPPGGKPIDYYEISVRQFRQQILPAGLPATTVWGYGPVTAQRRPKQLIHNAPSLTIEASHDQPVRIKWINKLVDTNGNFLPHLLPVDPTLHWANPPGGTDNRDSRPDFTDTGTPGPYTGPVPLVTHLHGSVDVGDESDGYAEAWFLPVAGNIPDDFATEGTWYDFFKGKAAAKFGVTWDPGSATFQYPNAERAATKWYHDHTLGMTRLNVYAGPAGFYLLRGGPEGDDAVLDSRSGKTAVLPGPAPQASDNFPSTKAFFEIPIAIQDRSFNTDGSLFYPDTRALFDGIVAPYIPAGEFPPIWNPEFFGNIIMVNGNTWPFQTVERRRYRLRFLNGCQSRFLILDFSDIPGVQVWAIGNEGGFLSAPVNLTATNHNQLLMGLAERADLIVDFTEVPEGGYILRNVGPDEPFSGGTPGSDFIPADTASTGQILQFRVVPPADGPDRSTPPEFLQLPIITPLQGGAPRRLALLEKTAEGTTSDNTTVEGPVAALLGIVDAQGFASERLWEDPVTENPAVGATEVWEFYNFTADAHPMHIHEVAFQVVNRQNLALDAQGNVVQPVQLIGEPIPPRSWETGFKDTVVALPGQATRVRIQFNTAGQFVWHCHIVEHEDNEMMRPYRIGPVQPGQPPN
jgi:FtsP/CotA-like multicopper oxidase with cupredoxin domain